MPALHMYSPLLSRLPSDVPEALRQSGFAALPAELRARLGEGHAPDGLDAWLEAGPPPVFFGFGSMPVRDPARLLATISSLCDRLGIRALIGAGWSQFGTELARDDIFIAPAFDHDSYLPRCRATVHHGGAGTTDVALRAGRPTLICSVFADQPLWGRRVTELGVGASLPFQRMTEARLAAGLEVLLRDDTSARAAALGAQLRAQDGLAHTVEHVERFAREQGLSAPP